MAEVVRRHEGPSPESLDLDENLKHKHLLFCRDIKICRDFRTFLKTCGQISVFRDNNSVSQIFVGRKAANFCHPTEVEALVANYEKEQVGGVDLQKFDTWREKICRVREFESCGISYMGRRGNVVQDVVQGSNVFVINASNDCSEEAKNNQLFFRKLQITHKGDPSFKFYWADIDLLTPSSWRGGKNKIIKYLNGEEVSGDVFKENGQDSGTPLVDVAHKQTQTTNELLLPFILLATRGH